MSETSNMEKLLMAIIELQQDTRKMQKGLQKMNARLEWYIRDYEEWKDEMKNLIIESLQNEQPVEYSKKEGEISNKEEIVYEYLKEFGLPTSVKGFKYLTDAIIMYNEPGMDSVTKSLYPKIGKKRNTTGQRVERAIRHAIEIIWSRGNTKMIDELFGYSIDSKKGRPTNSEFISRISVEIEMEYCK